MGMMKIGLIMNKVKRLKKKDMEMKTIIIDRKH